MDWSIDWFVLCEATDLSCTISIFFIVLIAFVRMVTAKYSIFRLVTKTFTNKLFLKTFLLAFHSIAPLAVARMPIVQHVVWVIQIMKTFIFAMYACVVCVHVFNIHINLLIRIEAEISIVHLIQTRSMLWWKISHLISLFYFSSLKDC